MSLISAAAPVLAQAPVVLPQRLPEFGRSVASTDDSTALLLNPANLAFLPDSELRWTGTFLPSEAAVPWQGHAFALAFPLPFSFATGLRLDLVDPPRDAEVGAGVSNANYQWLTWGLALRTSESMSLGASYEHSYSRGDFARRLSSWSLGASFRWFDELGISLVAQNINAPVNSVGRLGASYTLAAAVRPLGTRAVEIGLEGKFLDEEDVWIPRATLGVDLPYVGRLRGEFQVSDPGDGAERAWLASAGLSFYLNQHESSSELAAAGVFGDGLGDASSVGIQTGLAVRGFPEPVGLSLGRYAVRLRLEETPDAREHVGLLRGLWSLAEEPKLDALVLSLRASPAETAAHAQELRDALLMLRKRGKRVLCHVDDVDITTLYLCAAADQILINPVGNVRFAGLQSQYLFFGRLLENLGIAADVVAIGEHKSAPERFTRSSSSDVSRADKIDLLQQTERQITEGLAQGRNMTFAAVRAAAKEGPFMAEQAKTVGFVDGLAFDDEVDAALTKLVGRPTRLQSDDRRAPAPERFSAQPSIAVVYVEGEMIDGRSRRVPLLETEVAGSYTIAESLRAARENSLVKAVVLRIETPGGSSTAADLIWREVQLTVKVKPVIVSMGGYAASGGYYIAAPGTRIFANPSTLTGSIGVFYGKADASRLLDRIGVDVEVYKTSDRADADALYRPYTTGERSQLERNLRQFYNLFLERVAAGRKIDKSAVDRVAQGRVWTGEQAQGNGLVDEIGGLRQALGYARQLTGLPEDAPLIELPRIQRSLIGRLLGVPGINESLGAELRLTQALPAHFQQLLSAAVPFLIYPSHLPLTRLGFVAVEP